MKDMKIWDSWHYSRPSFPHGLGTNFPVSVSVLKPQLPADKTFMWVWYPQAMLLLLFITTMALVSFIFWTRFWNLMNWATHLSGFLGGYICLEKDGGRGQWISSMSTQNHNSGGPIFTSSLLMASNSPLISKLTFSILYRTTLFS